MQAARWLWILLDLSYADWRYIFVTEKPLIAELGIYSGCIFRSFGVPRYPQWEGVLDGQRMMTGDDSGGNVWTVARTWEGVACGGGAA